jgi:hypothetical protein
MLPAGFCAGRARTKLLNGQEAQATATLTRLTTEADVPYPYEESSSASEYANDIQGQAGACPPKDIEYRIYPEWDFTDLFGDPPDNVITA